jgi:propanol-preferring alcohol dehydrogenase
VSGLGGLGHLAIQYARKLGFYVVAVSGSPDKEELAKKLGAHVYFSAKDDVSVPEAASSTPR